MSRKSTPDVLAHHLVLKIPRAGGSPIELATRGEESDTLVIDDQYVYWTVRFAASVRTASSWTWRLMRCHWFRTAKSRVVMSSTRIFRSKSEPTLQPNSMLMQWVIGLLNLSFEPFK
jgi:hypothetical protein